MLPKIPVSCRQRFSTVTGARVCKPNGLISNSSFPLGDFSLLQGRQNFVRKGRRKKERERESELGAERMFCYERREFRPRRVRAVSKTKRKQNVQGVHKNRPPEKVINELDQFRLIR